MKFIIFIVGLFIVSCSAVSKAPKGCFRAATLDHVQQITGNIFNPTDADLQKEIKLNLKMYQKAAAIAKEHDADIIQFPEEGIQFGYSRKMMLKFGERLPKAPTDFTYCSEEFLDKPVLRGLACIAQQNKIFVSADMLDVQPFEPTPERNTSRDNVLIYNTQVVFDREGRLIAKYHKINLFNEPEKDKNLDGEPIFVDTEIGRLGLSVCFDILFSLPTHELVTNHQIDTLLFPTWWLDQLPFLQGSQIQASFASGHKINVIASNVHNVSRAARGSGIYAGNSSTYATLNNYDAKTKLLIANLPIHPKKQQCEMEKYVADIPQEVINPEPKSYFHLNLVKSSEMKMIKLNMNENSTKIPDESLNCSVEYFAVQGTINDQEEYYLIYANRTKPGPFPWNERFCAVVECPKNSHEPCKEFQQSTPLKTRFFYVSVLADFPIEVQMFPTLIGDMQEVISINAQNNAAIAEFISPDKTKLSITQGPSIDNKLFPIGTIGVYGRSYKHDKPYKNIKVNPEIN